MADFLELKDERYKHTYTKNITYTKQGYKQISHRHIVVIIKILERSS